MGENRAIAKSFRIKLTPTEWRSVGRKPFEVATMKNSLIGQTEQQAALGRSRGPLPSPSLAKPSLKQA